MTYTPDKDYHGLDNVAYQAANDATPPANSAPAAIAITVAAVINASIAANQGPTFSETAGGSLTLGAEDPDHDPISCTYTQPEHGTPTGAAPNLTYTPPPTTWASTASSSTLRITNWFFQHRDRLDRSQQREQSAGFP